MVLSHQPIQQEAKMSSSNVTMAAFTNQVSNLSALTSAIGAFSRILEVSEEFDANETEQLHHETAQSFLNSQRNRISEIERQVFQSTEHMRRSKSQAITATDLAELCRMVQESNLRQMEQLRRLMEAAGCEVPLNDRWAKEAVVELKKPHFTLLGCPLERVSEGDSETEGSVTPRPTVISSPFQRQNASKKKSMTSTTPTMDSFTFSNSTHSVKEENKTANTEGFFDDEDSDFSGDDLKYSSRSDSRQEFDNAFREEDDMITLDTQSTLAGLSLQGLQRQADAIFHEADRAEWRLQKTLEQVEESILESRPSDEANSCASSRSVETSFEGRSSTKYDREETLGDDDESTNMVVTVVAEDRGIKSRNTPHAPNDNSYNRSGVINLVTAGRPMHVLVDASAPSPSHTLLTMDGTMLNDTWMNDSMGALSVLGDDDVSSTMTPILDRYRLDPDDGSLGIKVVPNKRGHHKKKSLRKSHSSFDMQDVRNVLPTVYSGQKEMLSTPMSLPGSVSARKKKRFQKTPHPHKKEVGRVDYPYAEEENDDPNISQPHHGRPSYESKKENSLAATSVQPPRQRSLELRSSLPATPQNARARSMQPQSQPLTAYDYSKSHTSQAAHVSISRATANERRGERFQSSQSEPRQLTREFRSTRLLHTGKWIEKITMREYEVAPLAVREQVSRDEVNEAAGVLDHFLTASLSEDKKPLEFTEAQAYEVLRDYLDSAQKSKSVLLSLCHWRRLLMYRDSIHSMSFVVNQFEK